MESQPKVKVIDDHQLAPYNQLVVQKIDQIYNQSGEDWKDDLTLLVARPNSQLPIGSELDDGTKTPYLNLYQYQLNNRQAKLVKGEASNQVNARYSPNKRHIFYHSIQNIDPIGKGVIIDLMNQSVHPVETKMELDQAMGQWINSQQIIYATFETNQIYLMNIAGKSQHIPISKPLAVDGIAKLGQYIYFVTPDSKLYRLAGKKLSLMKNDVQAFAFSPNGQRLILRLAKPDHHEQESLTITDRNGNEQSPVIQTGGSIGEVSWSPDQKTVAYSVLADDEKKRGLFIYNIRTQRSTKILTDQTTFSNLRWSPSGKKLSVTDTIEKEGKYTYLNSIISFK